MSAAPAPKPKYRDELQRWAKGSPLTEVQEACIKELDARRRILSSRPLPAHLQTDDAPGVGLEAPEPEPEAESGAEAALAAPRTKEEFYAWFAAVDAKVEREKAAAVEQHIASLQHHHDECELLVGETSRVLERLERMRQCYVTVQSKTQEVHEQCDSLLREKNDLVSYADAIRAKLAYFDELDRIGAVFSAATTDLVKDAAFPGYLERLDECIAYVSVNLQYRDAEVYADRFRALQARGLSLVRDHFSSVLRETAQQVLPEVQKWVAEAEQAEGQRAAFSEESLLYAKFRAVAAPLKQLMGEIERRRATNELCVEMLLECQGAFLQIRQTLLADVIRAHLEAMRGLPPPGTEPASPAASNPEDEVDLATFARQGWGYMMRLCEREHSLWCHVFPDSAPTQSLRVLIEEHTLLLYDYLRPMYVHESTFDELVDCVHVLKTEIMEDEMGRRGVSSGFCRPTLERSIHDLQGKLIFLTQTYIRDEVETFEPSAQDLDYPAFLTRNDPEPAADAAPAGAASPRDGADGAARKGESMYDSWYPPLRSCLTCLSKLYRCVETAVFAELAHEAVNATSTVLLDASALITTAKGELHGGLFLVKNLLTLREQIQPFDVVRPTPSSLSGLK